MSASTPLDLAVLRQKFAQRPFRGALLLGLAMALVSLATAGLMLVGLSLVLPQSQWGPSAGAEMGQLSDGWLFFMAVLYVPLLETALGQALPIEIARRTGARPLVCVAASAVAFGAGHYFNGGLAHGLSALSAGLVFAVGYMLSRPYGFWPAFASASTTHAAHNFVLLFVLARVFPQWA